MREIETKTVDIPEGVTVNLEGKTVEVRGEKGSLVRDFSHAPVSIQLSEREIIVSASWPKRKVSALVGTVCSHIGNMIKGVTEGFTYRLKIVYSHFPITVKVEGNRVAIGNFIGERNPRIAKIAGAARVTVKGDDVIVQGISIEDVSQTAANIEQATTVKKRDPRKFLDGIYVYQKLEGMMD
jgi:large subunit ribosomal protein L6